MSNGTNESPEKRRSDFLMGMYSEMWGNVNRHLTVIWQSVGVLGAGLALFSLTEKHVIGADFATAAMIMVCFWLIANAYVASEWFNRNQAIISNIERQFLNLSDLQEINPYFASRRAPGDMVSHIEVQWYLGVVLSIAVLIRHVFVEVWPTIHWTWNIHDLDWNKTVPYFVFLGGFFVIAKIRKGTIEADKKFQKDCPGKNLNQSSLPPTK